MNVHNNRRPYLVLVDDDTHSARLLTRVLLAHGAPAIETIDGADAAIERLRALLGRSHPDLPGLVIVDLKSSSSATRDFVAALRKLEGADRLTVAAMAPSLERSVRDAVLDAGADAVFERHTDINTYRREAAGIVSFWVRGRHLRVVGA
ncbi:MAG: response regulator [Devosia sp.]|nr:response regulator [Devosia sp.]